MRGSKLVVAGWLIWTSSPEPCFDGISSTCCFSVKGHFTNSMVVLQVTLLRTLTHGKSCMKNISEFEDDLSGKSIADRSCSDSYRPRQRVGLLFLQPLDFDGGSSGSGKYLPP